MIFFLIPRTSYSDDSGDVTNHHRLIFQANTYCQQHKQTTQRDCEFCSERTTDSCVRNEQEKKKYNSCLCYLLTTGTITV